MVMRMTFRTTRPKLTLWLFLTAFAVWSPTFAADSEFFRLLAPSTTVVRSLSPDGTMQWSNAWVGVTCTVQTATNLLGSNIWFDYVRVPVSNSVMTTRLFDLNPPTNMAYIPAGVFTIGDPLAEGDPDEAVQQTVYVSGFWLDQYAVTGDLWHNVYNWAVGHGYSFDNTGGVKAAQHPVHTVNWYDAAKWCNARSEREGRTPAYYTTPNFDTVYRTGMLDLSNQCVRWDAGGYRLPTETEWEKAARGGATAHRFAWRTNDTITHAQANYFSTNTLTYDVSSTRGYHPDFATGDIPYTSPVGSFQPNDYGLYDMCGNVRQWCWDWYLGSNYTDIALVDPRGADGAWLYRVIRNNSWSLRASYGRASYRGFGLANTNSTPYATNYLGFRCVLK
jgi:formylglycine-generating enzyme